MLTTHDLISCPEYACCCRALVHCTNGRALVCKCKILSGENKESSVKALESQKKLVPRLVCRRLHNDINPVGPSKGHILAIYAETRTAGACLKC